MIHSRLTFLISQPVHSLLWVHQATFEFGGNLVTVLFCSPVSFIDRHCLFSLQGFALDVLTEVGVIQSHHFWLDVEHIQEAIQNVLVILEMVVFSVIQQYAYHVAPYSGADRAKFEKKNE